MNFNSLPSGWKLVTVDDIKASSEGAIAIGPFGSRMKADCYVPVGVPVIRGNNLTGLTTFGGDFVYVSDDTADSMRTCNAFGGDLVFPHRGAIGQVGLVPLDGKRYMLSTSLMKLSCNREIANPRFLYFFFRSDAGRHELLKNASTVGTPGIGQPLSTLRSIRLPLPPKHEQDRIADILGTLDDKIELNRRMNETLEAIARRLFKSWFVDFDPVHAKAALRRQHPKLSNADLSRRALPNMSPQIAELFPDGFEDSTLGPIPTGWRAGVIGDLATLDKSSVKPSEFPNEVFDHYSIPAFDNGQNPVRETGDQIMSNKFVVTGDCVLLTKLNPRIRRVWLPFPSTSRRSLCSTEFLVLKPNAKVPTEFLFSLVSSAAFFEVYVTMVTGTSGSHQRIRPEHLLKMQVVIPTEPVQTCFAKAVCDQFTHSESLRSESRSLAATRDRLLPRLLSGELLT